MSHFTVLIVGKDPEKQLEPFSEHIEVAEYQRDVISDEEKQSFMDVYQIYDADRTYATITEAEANVNKTLTFDELYERYGKDWNGNSWVKNSDGDWAEFSTYNPLSKWDWFELGGRWTGFFKIKTLKQLGFMLEGFSTAEVQNFIEMAENDPEKFIKVTSKYNGKTDSIRKAIHDMIDSKNNPSYAEHKVGHPGLMTSKADRGYADQALKRDIDFDAMRNEAGEKARKDYTDVLAVFGGVLPTIEHSWKSIIDGTCEATKDMDWNGKRKFYHDQTGVQLVNEKQLSHTEILGHFFEIKPYQCTIDEFEQRARKQAISTFAVLKDGKWYEKGEMGWWGITTNEKDEWFDEFNKLLDETPDDTLLSVYDCHI